MPADVQLGQFPNEFLGVEAFTNPVTSTGENLFNAPLKLNTEVIVGGVTGGTSVHSGTGSPAGVVAAGSGSIYIRTDTPATAGQRLYFCTVGGATAGATTWVASAA